MNIIEFLVRPYLTYTPMQIGMECIAAIFGVGSVFFAIRKSICVYPIGIVSTVLYTYLLYHWQLYGDMAINAYYTAVSIYGWWMWSSHCTSEEVKSVHHHNQPQVDRNTIHWHLFLLPVFFLLIFIIYVVKYQSWRAVPLINYVDSIMTAVFLVAMYLMAKKRIENWHYWIVGNAMAIPLFIYKGYGITALQYLIFLLMAFVGLYEWKKDNNLEKIK